MTSIRGESHRKYSFCCTQVYKQIKPVSELAVSKPSTILNDSFENNTQVNVTDVLLEISKVLVVS